MRAAALPLLLPLLALSACKGGADDTEDTDPGDGTEADTDIDTDTDLPDFPEGTFQLRVMNLTAADVNLSGTDADGGAVDLDVGALSFTGYESLPVGTGVLGFDYGGPAAQIDLSTLEEFDRVVVVVGEVAGYTIPIGLREPERDPASRTLVLGTTGRTVGLQSADAYREIPAGEQGEIRTMVEVLPNSQERVSWATYGKPFHLTLARVPAGGVGYVFNSDIAGDGWGTYYIATRSPGPVQVLRSDFPMYAYSVDFTREAGVDFTARTPFGDVPIASGVEPVNTGALPHALIPADTSEIVATDADGTVTGAFSLLDGLEHAIAVLHPVGGVSTLDFLQGEPNDRVQVPDGWITFKNLSDRNLDVRCYYNFQGWQAPGGAISTFIAPSSVLNSNSTQACNLTAAGPPDAPPSTPTHDVSLSTSRIRGRHLGFVEDDGAALRLHWAFRQTDDPNVYMASAVAAPRPTQAR